MYGRKERVRMGRDEKASGLGKTGEEKRGREEMEGCGTVNWWRGDCVVGLWRIYAPV